MEWNTVKYIDCMNKEEGLPSMKDKVFDVGITDPPFNRKYTGEIQQNQNLTRAKEGCYDHKVFYDDYREDYSEWCKLWFREFQRVCNVVIITPGTVNLRLWFEIAEPTALLIHYKKNCSGISPVARFNKFDPILFYGKPERHHPYIFNVFDVPLDNGFLRNDKLIHPCPRPLKLWKKLIEPLKPKSVLDPFIGSGTTSEACEIFGIPWYGFEIEYAYKKDIDFRVARGKRKRIKGEQETLDL